MFVPKRLKVPRKGAEQYKGFNFDNVCGNSFWWLVAPVRRLQGRAPAWPVDSRWTSVLSALPSCHHAVVFVGIVRLYIELTWQAILSLQRSSRRRGLIRSTNVWWQLRWPDLLLGRVCFFLFSLAELRPCCAWHGKPLPGWLTVSRAWDA